MSSYTDAVIDSVPLNPRQKSHLYNQKHLKTELVRVNKLIRTPHGDVVAGEIVEAEYHQVGGFFKKVKGAVKKVAKAPLKVTKATGRAVFKGTAKATKWVRKNPLKAAALVTPLGVAYAAYKGGKVAAKGAKKVTAKTLKVAAKGVKGTAKVAFRGATSAARMLPFRKPQAALPPMEEESYASEPESYPGEQYDSTATSEPQTPDVLNAPESSYDEEEASEESYDDSEESSEDSEDSDSDNSAIEGESDMANEEWVGLDEIAGYDEIAGDGDYEYVGGPAPRGKPGPNAVMVRKKKMTKNRRQPLAFNSSGTVAAGAQATITVTPQTLFRGRRLVVSETIAGSFIIDDVKVGNVSQFAASGSLNADAFAPSAVGEDNFQLDSCPPGMNIVLQVTNTSGGALQFRATLFGDSVQ